MSGSTAGGVIGAAIGYWVNGQQGAQIGWMVGSAVGGYVDPDVIKGQRLSDAQIQTSNEGVPRPIVYGVAVVAGNLIQRGPLVEHKDNQRTGKGGPVQESFTYTMTYAIRVCEGPVAGIRRIWRDDKLVYDVRDPDHPDDGITDAALWASSIRALAGNTGVFNDKISIYLGDEDQLPDPALEALPAENGGGVGNVPAYRGSCYVVFRDDDLTERGGTIPQYRFEVAAGVSVSHYLADNVVLAAVDGSGVLQSGPNYTDWSRTIDAGVPVTTGDVLVASCAGRMFHVTNGAGAVSLDRGYSWTALSGIPAAEPVALMYAPNFKRYFLVVNADVGLYSSHDGFFFSAEPGCPIPPGQAVEAGMVVTVLDSDAIYVSGSGFILSSNGGWTETLTTVGEIRALAKSDGNYLIGVGTAGIRRSEDLGATWSSAILHPLPSSPAAIAYGNGRFLIVDAGGNVASSDNNGVTWDLRDPLPETIGGLGPQSELIFDHNSNEFLVAGHQVHSSANGDDWVTRWTGRTNEIKSLATLDFTGAEGIPDIVGWYVINGSASGVGQPTMQPGSIYLGDIERDIASRVGITDDQFDTTQIDTIRVRGYVVGRQMPAADAIRSLQQGYFHDLPEYDLKLRAVLRGGVTAFDLTDASLVASEDDQDTRAQAVEFPRKINLISSDPNSDYEPVKQTASRRTDNVKAVGEATVELPLSLLRDEAAQKADIMLKVAWEEALGRWERELPEEFSRYVPSDCFTSNGKRWRIEKATSGDGTTKLEAVRDRVSAYTSTVTGSTGLNPTTPPLNLRGPTVFAAMNLPQLRTQDSTPGMYVAARGLLTGWIGARLQLSVDGGATFANVLDMTAPATLGRLSAACTASSTPISVLLDGGTLESVTTTQLAARANAFAIVTSGTAEVGQFQTATASGDGYDLTTLTRGELGTVAASHNDADRFVLLDTAVYFLPIDVSYAGQTLIFRPVSMGTAAANNAQYSVVYDPGETVIDGGVVSEHPGGGTGPTPTGGGTGGTSGLTARTRGTTVVDPVTYGADPTGVSDSTAAFNSAYAALPGPGANQGGTVRPSAGTYKIDPNTSVKPLDYTLLDLATNNVTLQGSYTATDHKYVVWCQDKTNVEIAGGTIIGYRDAWAAITGTTSEWGHGIAIYGCVHSTVRNTTIKKCVGDGISIGMRGTATRPDDIKIDNIVTTQNRRQGISVTNSTNVTVSSCEISYISGTAPQAGIDIEPDNPTTDNSTLTTVNNCYIHHCTGPGVQAYKSADQVTLTNNRIEYNSYGIYTVDSSVGTVTGNAISHNRYDGIRLTGVTDTYTISGTNAFFNNKTTTYGVVTSGGTTTVSGTSTVTAKHLSQTAGVTATTVGSNTYGPV